MKNILKSLIIIFILNLLFVNLSFAQDAPDFLFTAQASGLNTSPASSWSHQVGPDGNLNTTRIVRQC